MTVLRVGIAGYGVVGKRRRVCVDQHSSLELVGVCDQSFKENGEFLEGLKYFTNYNDLLKEKLDLLIVCLTNNINSEVTIAALSLGLHVFCEKPPGRNLDDIIEVIHAENKNPKLKLMYGFNHRYHYSVQDAIKIINSEELGKIINLRGVYGKSQLITFNQPVWRTKREIAGGGVLLDQGIHMVDLMRLFAGNFDEVYSFISNSYWDFDVEDNAYALMRNKDGVVGMLNSSATQWRHQFHLDINLERGSLILEGILSSSKSYGAETLTIVKAEPGKDNGDPKEQITRYNKDPSWQNEINLLVDCIVKDKKIESGSSEDAFESMKLVYRIYYSDKEWRDKYLISDPEKQDKK